MKHKEDKTDNMFNRKKRETAPAKAEILTFKEIAKKIEAITNGYNKM